MLPSIIDHRTEIITAASKSPITIATIDPGTNCSFRYTELSASQTGDNFTIALNIINSKQTLFRGSSTGRNYTARVAAMTKFLASDECFMKTDYYIIEAQFEASMTIQIGVLLGIITTLRMGEFVTRTKRSGTVEVCELPYMVLTVPTNFKMYTIMSVLKPPHRPSRDELKEFAILAASKIAHGVGDEALLEMLSGEKKVDDIADAYCHEYAILTFLHNPALLESLRHGPGAKKARLIRK